MTPKLREMYLKYIGEKFKNWDRIYLAWLEIGHVCSQNTLFFFFSESSVCFQRSCVCMCVCVHHLLSYFFQAKIPFIVCFVMLHLVFQKPYFPFSSRILVRCFTLAEIFGSGLQCFGCIFSSQTQPYCTLRTSSTRRGDLLS